MSPSTVSPSERTLHWFGDKNCEELLLEIDRIITTDKPALSALYEKLDHLRADYERLAEWASSNAEDNPFAEQVAWFARARLAEWEFPVERWEP